MPVTKFLRITGLLAIAGLVIIVPARADIERPVTRSYQISPGGWLRIDADLGTIQVNSGASDELEITVLEIMNTSSEKEADRILKDLKLGFIQEGGELRVTARYNRSGLLDWGGRRLKLRFNATVPARFNLDLHTSGGSITVGDLEGEVLAKTSGGSLSFGRIIGPVKAKTSGGSIKLAGGRGDADLITSGGSISIGSVEGAVAARTSGGGISLGSATGRAQLATSGGSISVDAVKGAIEASTSGGGITAAITAQPQQPCRLATSGGSIKVHLAPDLRLDINASTSGGHVHSEFDLLIHGGMSRSSLQGKLNGGGPELYLRTSGGNITLAKPEL
ncbi:MAG TPA: DUF4097 family beta strand repeat-containing protein [bacterium]|nr:DUF4097 family beta strand repeat-containing protein [bacterium]